MIAIAQLMPRLLGRTDAHPARHAARPDHQPEYVPPERVRSARRIAMHVRREQERLCSR